MTTNRIADLTSDQLQRLIGVIVPEEAEAGIGLFLRALRDEIVDIMIDYEFDMGATFTDPRTTALYAAAIEHAQSMLDMAALAVALNPGAAEFPDWAQRAYGLSETTPIGTSLAATLVSLVDAGVMERPR